MIFKTVQQKGVNIKKFNNNNNNKLQLGCHPVAAVILHVYKI